MHDSDFAASHLIYDAASPPGDLLADWAHHHTFCPWNADGQLIGTPGADTLDHVHQTTPFTCAVVSQEMILHEFGINVSEAQLVYDATVHGWLTDQGTPPLDAANLLEFYGVHTHMRYGADAASLAAELAQGHKVIVEVDASDLWGQKAPWEDLFHSPSADHALVVTGLNMADPNHPHVIVNDPGDPHGDGHAYPLDHFLHAWSASGRLYVATDDAPSHLADHDVFGANFNASAGIYMNPSYWIDLMAEVAGAVSAELVRDLLENAATAVNPVEAATYTLAGLSDAERNQLFACI